MRYGKIIEEVFSDHIRAGYRNYIKVGLVLLSKMAPPWLCAELKKYVFSTIQGRSTSISDPACIDSLLVYIVALILDIHLPI